MFIFFYFSLSIHVLIHYITDGVYISSTIRSFLNQHEETLLINYCNMSSGRCQMNEFSKPHPRTPSQVPDVITVSTTPTCLCLPSRPLVPALVTWVKGKLAVLR